jgi:hypothetical protein
LHKSFFSQEVLSFLILNEKGRFYQKNFKLLDFFSDIQQNCKSNPYSIIKKESSAYLISTFIKPVFFSNSINSERVSQDTSKNPQGKD